MPMMVSHQSFARRDLIECYETQGRKLRIGEILDLQRKLYQALDIDPPIWL